MKTQVSLFIALICGISSLFAQGTKTASTTTEKIKVWGNCDMCKERIEKAAKSAGASFALWNEEAKILTVKYNSTKTSNSKIQQKIADTGHDTQDFSAKEANYNKLPGCCQYDRKATTIKADQTAKCCKDKSTCTTACCTKKDMSCCSKEHNEKCCNAAAKCCTK